MRWSILFPTIFKCDFQRTRNHGLRDDLDDDDDLDLGSSIALADIDSDSQQTKAQQAQQAKEASSTVPLVPDPVDTLSGTSADFVRLLSTYIRFVYICDELN